MFQTITNSQTPTSSTTTISKQYPATTGLAITGAIGVVFLLPYIVIGGIGVGLYYAFKK